MQTRLTDSLQLDAYAGRRWTVHRQRRTVPAYEACMQPAMQGVDVGKSSVD